MDEVKDENYIKTKAYETAIVALSLEQNRHTYEGDFRLAQTCKKAKLFFMQELAAFEKEQIGRVEA
jgi:hypothetical protein